MAIKERRQILSGSILMKPPFLIAEVEIDTRVAFDILVFRTEAAVQGYIEAVDVLDEVYIPYDSEGRRLRFEVVGYSEPGSGCPILHDAEPEPTHQDELAAMLRRFLSSIGVTGDWLSTASLGDLVEYILLRHVTYEPGSAQFSFSICQVWRRCGQVARYFLEKLKRFYRL